MAKPPTGMRKKMGRPAGLKFPHHMGCRVSTETRDAIAHIADVLELKPSDVLRRLADAATDPEWLARYLQQLAERKEKK